MAASVARHSWWKGSSDGYSTCLILTIEKDAQVVWLKEQHVPYEAPVIDYAPKNQIIELLETCGGPFWADGFNG